ncbi:hypothetical protein [Devosia limi]|nr:hypothetical protein [Devosia limi]
MTSYTRDTIALFAIGIVAMLAVFTADTNLGELFVHILARL